MPSLMSQLARTDPNVRRTGERNYHIGATPGELTQRAQASPTAAMDPYQRAYYEANQANEQRYADILAGHEEREGMAEGLFDMQRADVRQLGFERGAQTQQQLAARGLGGSSLGATMQQGIDREMNLEMARLTALETQFRIGLAGERLAFMASREDVHPDLSRGAELTSGAAKYAPAANATTQRTLDFFAMPWQERARMGR